MRKIHELTPQQQLYASEHHNLVYKFLHKRGLSIEEYYDVVIFGYLLAVQEYMEKPALSRFSFTTIAWRKMCDCVAKEWNYRHCPKRSAHLEPLDEEGDFADLDDLLPNRMQSIAESLDNQELVLRLLSHLTPKEKEVVRLKAEGYTYREISEHCKITIYGVGNRFYRLRRRLREQNLL